MVDSKLNPTPARAPFRHQPLDLSKNEIRLLTILPDLSDDGLVQCHVYHTSRDRPESRLSRIYGYNALSYEWGPALKDHMILMNGVSYSVRSNLYAFLSRARRNPALMIRPIWIDAICINQLDVMERNHQVSQMRAIYSQAANVFIWLGEQSEPAAKKAVSWFLETSPFIRFRIKRNYKFRNLDTEELAQIDCAKALLFESSYWSRAWIVQELLFAKRRTALIGDRRLTWSAFVTLYRLTRTISTSSSTCGKFVDRLSGKRDRNLDWPLTETYYNFGSRECSEPLDKIYAYAGLSTSGIPFPIDYNCSIIVALVNAAAYCAVESHSAFPRLFRQATRTDRRPYSLAFFAMAMQRVFEEVPVDQIRNDSAVGLKITELNHIADRALLGGWKQFQLPWHYGEWPPARSIRSAFLGLALMEHGFEVGDWLVQQDCDLLGSNLWDITLVVRIVDGRRCKVVGRLKSHPDFGYGLERYAEGGLPGVQVMLRHDSLSKPLKTVDYVIAGLEHVAFADGLDPREKLPQLFEHLIFTDVRATVVLFGLPDDDAAMNSIRSTALHIIAESTEEGADYFPVKSWFKAWPKSEDLITQHFTFSPLSNTDHNDTLLQV